ncbi:MAG: protein kinase [Candidatus Aminicenantes bacterium]|nr:MAG: protein kinase [Candidatus Aminicenantes bacterium]
MSIKCPKCQTNNPDTLKFCGECGTQLPSPKDIEVTETIETHIEELTTGSTFADRYQIIEELGKGGMGKVYRALDKKLNEEVALKLIKPEIASDKKTLERFSNELKLARKISHRNVGRMYELLEERGTHYITMEYVPGEDLRSSIRRFGQLPIGKSVSIANQICEGLSEAHRLGVVHRDLKPSNIMIDKDGNARIMDFGIARSLKAKGITGAGVMVGTPEYMSPEQAEVKEVDQRSDIYSLGVILYEMVTGRVPFEGETPLGIAMKHKSEEPSDPRELNSQIPEDLSRVILRCLEKDKAQRYQSAGEVRSELENVEKGIPTTEREIPKRKPITSKEITVTFGIKKLFIPALVVVALVIVSVITWQLTSQKKATLLSSDSRSIAVLPFSDLSPQRDQAYLCDGMAETIIAKLSSIKELKVIPRTSVMRYKDTEKSIKEIGQELGVSTILEASIQKEEDNIRLIAKLTNVEDGFQLWSETYDRRLESVFAIQSDIAEKITGALKMELSPEEKERLEKKPTESLTAYDYYLKGREYYNRYQKQHNEQAIKLFKKALEVDKDYALAYAGLGDAYAQGVNRFGSPSTLLDLAIDASQTAISIDPDCSEAHKALALAYFYKGWLRKAINMNRKAIEINPNLDTAIINLAINYLFTGEFEKGMPLVEKNLALKPADPWSYHIFAFYYYYLNDIAKAEQWEEKSLELNPDFIDSNAVLMLSYLVQGKNLEAVEHSQKLFSMFPRNVYIFMWVGETALFAGDIPQARQYYQKAAELSPGQVNGLIGIRNSTRLGYIYWISGDSVEAQNLFTKSLSLDQKEIEQGNELWVLWNDMAAVHAVLGDKEEAYKCLKKSIEAGWRNFRFGQIEPMFENLRNDKNFNQMMAEMKGLVDEMRKRIEKKD